MENIIKDEVLIPAYGIVVYYQKSKKIPVYIEKGNFTKKGEGYSLTGLRPFVSDELRNLQKIGAANKGLYCDGLLNKNILFINSDPNNAIVVWVESACKRVVNFKEDDLRKEYNVPATIFIMQNNDLYVYLLKKKDVASISMGTVLYQSHYFNVYGTGILCVGTGYKPNVDHLGLNELIQKQSLNFWTDSYFTHPNHDHEQLKEIWENQNGNYPEKNWKKITNLKDLLSKFLKI